MMNLLSYLFLFYLYSSYFFITTTNGVNVNTKKSFRSQNMELDDNIATVQNDTQEDSEKNKTSKLLVIMIDGFRWDYLKIFKQNLDGLDEFLAEGVQAKYVVPVFPSMSYPAWATLSTGVFPEVHGILGNYMWDQRVDEVFDINNMSSTKRVHWWQNSEPIWTTATREGKKCFIRYWSRADVPFGGTYPDGEFSGYRAEGGIASIQNTLNIALEKLRENDLIMVYGEHIDNIGHQFGPNSSSMAVALKEFNTVFKGFLDELMDEYYDIYKDLNIVIVSDHGMTSLDANTTFIELSDYLDINDVMKILGNGAVISIAPIPKNTEKVYDRLKKISGATVYRRSEIPEKFHYKNNRLVQEILLVAKPGFYIRGIPEPRMSPRAQKQFPTISPVAHQGAQGGTHGYGPESSDMRTIFYARGPAFKKGIVTPPIRLEDIYQIFTRVLEIRPQPNNGTWSRVSSMLVNSSQVLHFSTYLYFSTFFVIIFLYFNY